MKNGILLIAFLFATNYALPQSCDKLIEKIELSFQSDEDPKKDIQRFEFLCAKSSSYYKGKLLIFRLKQYRSKGQIEEGLDYAESILNQLDDKELNAEILLETAAYYFLQDKYDKTIPVCYKILNSGIKNKKINCKTLSILASAHSKLGNDDYAEKYYKKCYSESVILKDSSLISIALNGLGLIEYKKNSRPNLLKAVNYYNTSLSYCTSKMLDSKLFTKNNIAAVYYQLKDYEGANRIFKQCLDLAIQIRDTISMFNSLNNLGTIALIREDLTLAKSYLYQGYKIYQQYNPGEPMPSALLLSLSDLHYALGEYKQSRDFYEQYSTYSFQLLDTERNQTMIQMQEKFDALNKKKEIKDLKFSALVLSEVLTHAIQWTCAIIFLFLFRKLDRPFRLIAIISFIQTPIAMMNSYMLISSLNNSIIKHIATHLEFILLGLCFYFFLKDTRLKIGLILAGSFYAVFSLLDTIYLEPYATVAPVNIILFGSVICFMSSLGLFYEIFREGKILYIDRHPYFWLSCSVLIYFGCTIFISLFNNYIVYNLPIWIYNFFFSFYLFIFFVSKALLLNGAYLVYKKHNEPESIQNRNAIQTAI